MAEITWDSPGSHVYHEGLDRGVFYDRQTRLGVPWNGLIGVDESPASSDAGEYYIDGYKYYQSSGKENFAGTITAYTYPDEFERCLGLWDSGAVVGGLLTTHNPHEEFHLSYRTGVGSDLKDVGKDYIIHLVYNVMIGTESRDYGTRTDSPDPMNFSFPFTTRPTATPEQGTFGNHTAHFMIDTRRTHRLTLIAIEEMLYGTMFTEPKLPTPTELLAIFNETPPWSCCD